MSTSRGWLAAATTAQGWRRAQAAAQSSRSTGWARSRPSLARLTGAMASTTSWQPARWPATARAAWARVKGLKVPASSPAGAA